VRFYIWTPESFRKLIESHIYAHYPDIEVVEASDYVSLAPTTHEEGEWDLWGCEFALTKPDPYPIKTYVDYGLDSALLKEEQKSDPMTSLIEFLGTIGQDQFLWIQILVMANRPRYKTAGTWFGHHDWKTEGKNLIKEIKEKSKDAEGKSTATKREQDILNAVERSLEKPGFDCGIRAINIARKDRFDAVNNAGLTNGFKQYSSADLNGFKAVGIGFDYPWKDPWGKKLAQQKKDMFDAYIRRSYFYPPHKKKPFVLNIEELATIYHFPGGVAETPTFSRIESRKGEPPSDLPI
jgi:hypothetical protein